MQKIHFFFDRQDKKMCGNGKCIKKSADSSLIGYYILICINKYILTYALSILKVFG